MITAGHINSLLELQKATNVAYFGDEWKNVWSQNAVDNSIYREWAEFLDETSLDWKIYGNGQIWDRTNAVYELVDVVHFMLSGLLIGYGNALPIKFQLSVFDHGYEIMKDENKTHLGEVTESFTRFMSNSNVTQFGRFLAKSCSYLSLDAETYMLAHKRKNDRNRLRAAGGADYDKSAETPLTLEF